MPEGRGWTDDLVNTLANLVNGHGNDGVPSKILQDPVDGRDQARSTCRTKNRQAPFLGSSSSSGYGDRENDDREFRYCPAPAPVRSKPGELGLRRKNCRND